MELNKVELAAQRVAHDVGILVSKLQAIHDWTQARDGTPEADDIALRTIADIAADTEGELE